MFATMQYRTVFLEISNRVRRSRGKSRRGGEALVTISGCVEVARGRTTGGEREQTKIPHAY